MAAYSAANLDSLLGDIRERLAEGRVREAARLSASVLDVSARSDADFGSDALLNIGMTFGQAHAALGETKRAGELLYQLARLQSAGSPQAFALDMHRLELFLAADMEEEAANAMSGIAPRFAARWFSLADDRSLVPLLMSDFVVAAPSPNTEGYACLVLSHYLCAQGRFTAAAVVARRAGMLAGWREHAANAEWCATLAQGLPVATNISSSQGLKLPAITQERMALEQRQAFLEGRIQQALDIERAVHGAGWSGGVLARAELGHARLLIDLNALPQAWARIEIARAALAQTDGLNMLDGDIREIEQTIRRRYAALDVGLFRAEPRRSELSSGLGQAEADPRDQLRRTADPEADVSRMADYLLSANDPQLAEDAAGALFSRAGATDSLLLKARAEMAMCGRAIHIRELDAAERYLKGAGANLVQTCSKMDMFAHAWSTAALARARESQDVSPEASGNALSNAHHQLEQLASGITDTGVRDLFSLGSWRLIDDALDAELEALPRILNSEERDRVSRVCRWRSSVAPDRQRLKQNEAMLHIVRTTQRAFLCLETQNNAVWGIVSFGRVELAAIIRRLHSVVREMQVAISADSALGLAAAEDTFNTLADELFCKVLALDKLIESASLPPQIDMLWIAAEGELRAAPFEAAPYAGGLLGDRFAIAYAGPPHAAHAKGVGAAGFYLGESAAISLASGIPYAPSREYSLLPGAGKEAESAQRGFAHLGLKAMRGGLQTSARDRRSELLLALRKMSHVHVAGHGDFFPEAPSLSGLIIPDAESRDRAELFSIRDIPPELGASHVMLAACFGGDALALSPGRVVSLPEALCQAGVDVVATHLWRASDAFLPTLCAMYYEAMASLTPVRAAAHVRRAMRAGAPGLPDYANSPAIWAAFVIIMATS